ncbi:hypothetical protein P5V15_001089 [Pogonomyrmex californicus]
MFIYDLLNGTKLHIHHEQFLKRLFPTYNFEKNSAVKFPVVQHQSNSNDCGVFTIAFAVSLLFNIKPEKVKYNHSLMRLHLLKILEINIIDHFSQDSHNAVIKMLPLTVIKDREARAAYMRSICQSEKKYITKDKECLENKHAKKRRQYNEHLEDNRAKKRCLYNKNLIDNRAKKRYRYQENVEHNHIKDRQRYTNNRLKIYEQKCMRYILIKNGSIIRYYLKRTAKSVVVLKKLDVQKIIKRYEKFRSKNFIKNSDNLESFTKNIANKLNIKEDIKKRLQAEKIVRDDVHQK